MKHKPLITIVLIVLSILLSACGPSKEELAATYAAETIAAASPTPTVKSSETPTSSPTVTATPTSTPTPTLTSTPPPTATPTITPTPTPLAINPGNASQVTLLDTLTGFAEVDAVIFLPDGVAAVRVSEEGTLRNTLVQPHVLLPDSGGHTWAFGSSWFSADGKLFASQPMDSNGYWVSVWELADDLSLQSKVCEIFSYSTSRRPVSFSSNGEYLVSIIEPEDTVIITPGCAPNCQIRWGSPYVAIYHLPEGNLVSELEISSLGVFYTREQFSPDSAYLATMSHLWDPNSPINVHVWQVSDGQIYRQLGDLPSRWSHGENVNLAFSPDGERLAIVAGGMLQSWQWEQDIILWTVDGIFSALDYSPDGSLLATGVPDGSVQLWQASDGAALVTLSGHQSKIAYVAFSPDGSLLASLDENGVLMLWSVPH